MVVGRPLTPIAGSNQSGSPSAGFPLFEPTYLIHLPIFFSGSAATVLAASKSFTHHFGVRRLGLRASAGLLIIYSSCLT
jgi:hypothetical protein